MLKLVSIVSFVVLTSLTLFTVAHAQVQNPQSAPAIQPQPPQTQCITSAGTVKIEALPDASGAFPVSVACPSNPFGVSDCLEWTYRYSSLSGNNISVSGITVDSDVDIVAATSGTNPETGTGMKIYDFGSSDSSLGQAGSGSLDIRAVKFASNAAVVVGHIYTKLNVSAGTVTAISKVGNAGASTCPIAGPDNIDGISVGKAPLTTTQFDVFEGCNITLPVDSKGCPNALPTVISDPGVSCVAREESPSINGVVAQSQPFKGGVCGNRFVSGDNTCVWYCPNTYGKCYSICK